MAHIVGNPKREFGKKLCEVMGLDPNNVSAIEIRVAANEVVAARVNIYLDEKVVTDITNLVAHYNLVPR